LINFSPVSEESRQDEVDATGGGNRPLDRYWTVFPKGKTCRIRYLVNYDIHWIPVRIIQRFGRIDDWALDALLRVINHVAV